MASLLVLLITLAFALHASGLFIKYNITLTCDRIPWGYEMNVFERYGNMNSSLFSNVKENKTAHEANTWVIKYLYGANDEPFTNTIEVHGSISHNCTEDGTIQFKDIRREVLNFKNGKDGYYTFSAHLGPRPIWY